MPSHSEYELTVRQQPKEASMCGVGGKGKRRPIDPPPIVQLRVTGASSNGIHSSYYFMFASLAPPDTDEELHLLRDGKTRYTTGTVVSSLYHLKDVENGGQDAGFFVFPDLSVRLEGSYRLKLTLFEVTGTGNVHPCKSIFSKPFYVYTAKKFPGMEEPTGLLANQGIKIRVRKDVRVRKHINLGGGGPAGGVGDGDREDDKDEDDDEQHAGEDTYDEQGANRTRAGSSKRPRLSGDSVGTRKSGKRKRKPSGAGTSAGANVASGGGSGGGGGGGGEGLPSPPNKWGVINPSLTDPHAAHDRAPPLYPHAYAPVHPHAAHHPQHPRMHPHAHAQPPPPPPPPTTATATAPYAHYPPPVPYPPTPQPATPYADSRAPPSPYPHAHATHPHASHPHDHPPPPPHPHDPASRCHHHPPPPPHHYAPPPGYGTPSPTMWGHYRPPPPGHASSPPPPPPPGYEFARPYGVPTPPAGGTLAAAATTPSPVPAPAPGGAAYGCHGYPTAPQPQPSPLRGGRAGQTPDGAGGGREFAGPDPGALPPGAYPWGPPPSSSSGSGGSVPPFGSGGRPGPAGGGAATAAAAAGPAGAGDAATPAGGLLSSRSVAPMTPPSRGAYDATIATTSPHHHHHRQHHQHHQSHHQPHPQHHQHQHVPRLPQDRYGYVRPAPAGGLGGAGHGQRQGWVASAPQRTYGYDGAPLPPTTHGGQAHSSPATTQGEAPPPPPAARGVQGQGKETGGGGGGTNGGGSTGEDRIEPAPLRGTGSPATMSLASVCAGRYRLRRVVGGIGPGVEDGEWKLGQLKKSCI